MIFSVSINDRRNSLKERCYEEQCGGQRTDGGSIERRGVVESVGDGGVDWSSHQFLANGDVQIETRVKMAIRERQSWFGCRWR
jgi:hypothetical protein